MYSVSMAILDYVPVFLFGYNMVLLYGFMKPKSSKLNLILLLLGSVDVFFAGFLKATYKMLIALEVAKVPILSDLFLPMQASGFFLCGLFVLLLFCQRNKAYSIALPALLTNKMTLVGLMVIGVVTFDGGLAVLAAKRKNREIMWCFLSSCVLALVMGYLSGKDFTMNGFNWLAEVINTVSQLLFLLGAVGLAKTKKAVQA